MAKSPYHAHPWHIGLASDASPILPWEVFSVRAGAICLYTSVRVWLHCRQMIKMKQSETYIQARQSERQMLQTADWISQKRIRLRHFQNQE